MSKRADIFFSQLKRMSEQTKVVNDALERSKRTQLFGEHAMSVRELYFGGCLISKDVREVRLAGAGNELYVTCVLFALVNATDASTSLVDHIKMSERTKYHCFDFFAEGTITSVKDGYGKEQHGLPGRLVTICFVLRTVNMFPQQPKVTFDDALLYAKELLHPDTCMCNECLTAKETEEKKGEQDKDERP